MPKIKHEKRNIAIKVSVNEEEYKQLNERKDEKQLASWLRKIGLGAKPIRRADPKLIQPLGRIGSNLNQIAKYANINKELDKEILNGINEIRSMMQKLIDENKNGV